MNRIRQLLNDATAAFGRLTARERGLVSLSGGAVLFLVIALTSLSVSRAVSRREARIRTKAAQLEEVAKLTTGYRAAETQRQELEHRLASNKLQLFSYLDELAKREKIEIGGLSDKGSSPIPDTKVVEASVEVTFTRISLDKMLKFLQVVESGQGLIKVTRLQLRPRTDEPVLDAWLVLTTYTLSSS